jgi:hypothetical protein
VCVLAREGGSSERYLLHSYMGLEAVADSECLKGRGEKIKRAHSCSRGNIGIIYCMKGPPLIFFTCKGQPIRHFLSYSPL